MSPARGRLILTLVIGIPGLVFLILSIFRPVLYTTDSLLDPILSATCHRLPERSLHLPWGTSGLCARCTFFWFGLASGAFILYKRILCPKFGIGFLLLLPLIGDGTVQYFTLYESSNIIRMITGLCAGTGIAFILLGEHGRKK